jgi:hypothetical protein
MMQGFGDIVPVTDGGRGFLYVWAFFGCGLWALITGAVVSLAYDWVLFGLVLWPMWHVRQHRRKRRLSLHASSGGAGHNGAGRGDLEMSVVTTVAAMGQSGMGGSLVEGAAVDLMAKDELVLSGGMSGVAMSTINASQVNEAYGDLNPSALEAQIKAQEVLSWPAVSLLVLSGAVVYFGVHLVGAAVLLVVEPDLAFYKLPRYFPNNFGEGLYFTITSSQTMCTPTPSSSLLLCVLSS